jgi:hypothetical protein
MDVMTVATMSTVGLIIHPTFDSSITGNPNAAAIEAMIVQPGFAILRAKDYVNSDFAYGLRHGAIVSCIGVDVNRPLSARVSSSFHESRGVPQACPRLIVRHGFGAKHTRSTPAKY